jgi:FkbH-like protein/FkbM family methyltransferase
MALCVDRELSKSMAGLVRNVSFDNPIILSAEDTAIRVEARFRGNGLIEYVFYEVGAEDDSAQSPVRQRAARLEIERDLAIGRGVGSEVLSIEDFLARANVEIDSGQFYGSLRENGNQYGPGFQNVSSIWRLGNQTLAKLSAAREHVGVEPQFLRPGLLDSLTQLLATFIAEQGKTFVLRSIERVEVTDDDYPESLWGHATRTLERKGGERDLLGDVCLFDDSGKRYLRLSGVAITLLDRAEAAGEQPVAKLAVASNFTAEPIEESLKFWGDYFGIPLRVEFAPYNQVLQQLLDTGSALRRNGDGANVVLLGLEEWATGDRGVRLNVDPERLEQCFEARPRHVLPNGVQIVHLNKYETEYLYKEIFEDQCYLRHGIRLRDRATVVDIGANIGLFSLFVMSHCPNPTIYAFEPAPVLYDLLKANCAAYGSNVRALNVGVSDRPKTATFTFYEKSSVFSGFYSDEADDREAIQAVVRNMLSRVFVAGDSVESYVKELTADRLRRSTQECRLTSVSDIIRENRIDRIDLLKIDAEKSELDIIKGIDDRDWPKIDQIVMEIHDPSRESVKRVEELLNGRGYRCTVEQESLLERAGLFNLYATRLKGGDEIHAVPGGVLPVADASARAHEAAAALKRNIGDFCAALRSLMNHADVPLVLCICPRTPAAEGNPELRSALVEAEEALLSEAGRIAQVHTISSASVLQRYPLADYYDPNSHHLGHIPYTPDCYAAIGTALIRTIHNFKRNPCKVIVLDCDNTLWKGVCGEDGPLGVEVTAPFRALQEFMVGQVNSGMLLCLCSKNNEKDVLDVFDQRTDMPLKREHLVSWRINWGSKSQNIKSLAKELNLGLDSFIFIDDNPVDCADVRIGCPSVLTLQLPQRVDSISTFLNHVWAFDRKASTKEDKNRTRMYQEGAKRERYREQVLSLKDFVKGLQLRIEVGVPTEDQLDRVSQLTLRTNQFNFTTIRRSKSEIERLLAREDARCLVVRVVDRFGDYGLVGVLIYEKKADRYRVDTFLLSCRVLGRGVEHALVSQLGKQAVEEGKQSVEFVYAPTEKNMPVLEFITSIGAQYRNENGTSWVFPAKSLATVEYDPEVASPTVSDAEETDNSAKAAPRSALSFNSADRSERLQGIGEDLCDLDRVVKAIGEYRFKLQPAHAAGDEVTGSTLEASLAEIWKKVLGRPRIGINDNFFEAGGTSLKAVQLIAAIKKELKLTLAIVSLFECPTIRLLAAKLCATPGEEQGGAAATAAALRGRQRRYGALRRKAS